MMHKSLRISAFIVIAVIASYMPDICARRFEGDISIQQVSNLPAQQHKKITFLNYIAADNNLAEYATSDILEMASVGSNENLNVLAYLSTRQPGQPKITKKLFVQRSSCIQDGDSTPRDSGDVKTLVEALTWAITKFPSDHFVLVLWNHGSGSLNRFADFGQPSFWWMPLNGRNHCNISAPLYVDDTGERSVCYDDTTGNYLTDAKLIQALSIATNLLGKKIDIVAFDACLMADIEIAFTLQPYADYIVASQETIPGDGYGYGKVLSYAATGAIDSRSFAKGFVDAYQAEYQEVTDDYTLSAIETNKISSVVATLNEISKLLQQLLKSSDARTVRYIIKTSRARSIYFTEEYYIDLLGFYKGLLKQLGTVKLRNIAAQRQLNQLLQTGINTISAAVFAQARGPLFSNVGGLSIYFDPRGIDTTYPTLYWSQHTAWLNLLTTYLNL